MTELYVLRLVSNKFYIGKTSDLSRRLNEHFSGKGASWTKKYPPVEVIYSSMLINDFEEDNLTLKYMKDFGIQNVRGGSFSQMNLSDDILTIINRIICSSEDRCFNCGKKGHFANSCKQHKKRIICYSCGKEGHYSSSCKKLKNEIYEEILFEKKARIEELEMEKLKMEELIREYTRMKENEAKEEIVKEKNYKCIIQ